tara:strand:- start:1116 stop:1643 length:528 start_codon:yes stop_codon:yes gene_type:complete
MKTTITETIDMKELNTEQKRAMYVNTMLPDCPEDNPLIGQVLATIEGHEERITSLVVYEGYDNNGLPRVVATGDCPCAGAKCRAGWQWVMKARDLDMSGHRGSLWAVACEDAPKNFNAETGDVLPLPPMGVNAKEWSRFQTSRWGDVSKLDEQMLAQFSLATSEGATTNSWKVDN